MSHMTKHEYEELTRGAAVLAADDHGPKVLLRPDGYVIKLFRRKRLLSSAIFRPYAARFFRASRALQDRGFDAARVEQYARVSAIRRDVVVYRRVDGLPLRQALSQGAAEGERLLSALADILARLHARGVYFRAAHFGNIIVRSAQGAVQLALIDLSETRFRRRPLTLALRARNFRPMTRYPEDVDALRVFGVQRFVSQYIAMAHLDARQSSQFRLALRRIHPAFAEV
jgi:hypothetical protein